MRMIQIVSACMLLAACKAPRPEVVVHPPPQVIVASLESLADSIMPGLSHALDAAGLHPGRSHSDSLLPGWSYSDSLPPAWSRSDSLLPYEPDVGVYPLFFGGDSTSQRYHASINVESHHHEFLGFPMMEWIHLEFVTIGTAGPWALLTTDGYLYDGLGESDTQERSDLPLDLQVAIRNLFKDQLDIRAWSLDRAAEQVQQLRDQVQDFRRP